MSGFPVKAIFLRDQTINSSVENIVKGLSPHDKWPICFNYRQKKMLFEPLPDGGTIEKEFILEAFNDLSGVDVDFEIVLIEN